ncbi:S26 family signal peptidase [Cellulomonas triticagri]|uniref:S26 family signal peptidase n=1 Tax=Cellulomonas triticagri TaxID=2483352 RepID=UPI0018F74516|nr:S26 family signal peptidase [Cellulomonas triticagri]
MLTLAALFGAVCLVMVVLVATLDLGVIVFRTGSMSPTIPTGAAALVRSLPADQVEVGDVVTVPSPVGGTLPVTHRVIAVEPQADGTTRLRLRGDANEAEDPFPYDVTEVRRVVASAPGVGFALVRLGDPKAMAGITVGIAALVGWALWPRARHEPRGSRRERRRGAESVPEAAAAGPATRSVGTGGLVGLVDPAGPSDLADHGAPTDDADAPVTWPRLRAYRGATRTGAAVLVVTLGAGLLLLGSPAPAVAAAPVRVPADVLPPDGTPPPDGFSEAPIEEDRLLQLSSSLPLGGRWDLSPGTDLAWRVESTVRPPEGYAGARGTLWVSLFAGGPLVERGGVSLVVQMCDAWAADGVTCPGGAREVPAGVSGGEARVDRAEVGPVETGAEQAVVVRLRVPAGLGDEFQGLDMSLGLRFDAFGEEYVLSDVLAALDDGPGSTSAVLGMTGADLRPAVWAALAVLTGAVAVTWARRRREERQGVQHGA